MNEVAVFNYESQQVRSIVRGGYLILSFRTYAEYWD